MAALSPDTTQRYKVFYTNTGHQHVQQWRNGSPISPSAMETFLQGVWADMTTDLFPTTIDDVQVAVAGSNIFNSVVMASFIGNTYGSGTPDNIAATQFWDFIGRSSDARRVRVSWFGTKVNDESFRFNAGERTSVDNVVAALQGNAVDLATISGGTPIWKSYADAGFNAYWQRNSRS